MPFKCAVTFDRGISPVPAFRLAQQGALFRDRREVLPRMLDTLIPPPLSCHFSAGRLYCRCTLTAVGAPEFRVVQCRAAYSGAQQQTDSMCMFQSTFHANSCCVAWLLRHGVLVM